MNHKQIAARIRADYVSGDARVDGDRIEFRIGTLRVSCDNNRESVDAVIAKFKKGLPRNGRTFSVPSSRSGTARFNAGTFLEFWSDGERDNAMEYARLFPESVWPAPVKRVIAEDAA